MRLIDLLAAAMPPKSTDKIDYDALTNNLAFVLMLIDGSLKMISSDDGKNERTAKIVMDNLEVAMDTLAEVTAHIYNSVQEEESFQNELGIDD